MPWQSTLVVCNHKSNSECIKFDLVVKTKHNQTKEFQHVTTSHSLVMGILFSHAKHHCISKTKHHMYNLKLLELDNTQVLSSLNCILHIFTHILTWVHSQQKQPI